MMGVMLTRHRACQLLEHMGLPVNKCVDVDVAVRVDAVPTVTVTYTIDLKELAEMLASLDEPNHPQA